MFSFRKSPPPRRRGSAVISFRPGAEVVEPRILLSALPGEVLPYHDDNAVAGQEIRGTTRPPASGAAASFGTLFTVTLGD